MALRYFDGFDFYPTGDLASRYSIVGGAFVTDPTGGRFGTGCVVNGVTGGQESIQKFLDPQPAWVIGFAYRFTPGGVATKIAGLSGPEGGQVWLAMDSGNHLQLLAGDGGAVLATGSTVLMPNTYYFLELKATIASSCPPGGCAARVAGVTEVVAPPGANTNPNNSGTASRVVLWYDARPVSNRFDDFYVCDGGGDFLGDMRVETLLPSALGQYADFTVSGAADRVRAVNEAVEDGDASYVSASAVGDAQSYRFPNLVSNPSAIAGMQLVTVARKDDAGSRALAGLLRMAGVDSLGPELGLSDTYAYLTTMFETNPATGRPWTGAEVNAVEAGFKITR